MAELGLEPGFAKSQATGQRMQTDDSNKEKTNDLARGLWAMCKPMVSQSWHILSQLIFVVVGEVLRILGYLTSPLGSTP